MGPDGPHFIGCRLLPTHKWGGGGRGPGCSVIYSGVIFCGPCIVVRGEGSRQAAGLESLDPVTWGARGKRFPGFRRFLGERGQAFSPAAPRPFLFEFILLGARAPFRSVLCCLFAARVSSHAFVSGGAKVAWEDAQVEEASAA